MRFLVEGYASGGRRKHFLLLYYRFFAVNRGRKFCRATPEVII